MQAVYEESLRDRAALTLFPSIQSMEAGLEAAQASELPHLIIADLRLPDGSFIEYLESSAGESFAERHPFLVVSHLDEMDVLQRCFDKGAIDYLTKPLNWSEMVLKVERALASLRTAEGPDTEGIEVDPVSHTISYCGTVSACLTSKEFQIAAALIHSPKCTLSKETLFAKIWGSTQVHGKTVNVHLGNLRKKLNDVGLDIRFRPMQGYSLECATEQAKAGELNEHREH